MAKIRKNSIESAKWKTNNLKILVWTLSLVFVSIFAIINFPVQSQANKYLNVAKKAADKYLSLGIHQSTGLFFTQVYINGTVVDMQNFAEEERLYQSLILLFQLTGNTTYTAIAKRAADSFITLAPHPNTYLPPQGDNNYYKPIAGTRTTICHYTENLIDVESLWHLATNQTALNKLLNAYYMFGVKIDETWISATINIETGNVQGIHNPELCTGIAAAMMAQMWHLTQNYTYLKRAEEIWQYWKLNNTGATGLLYNFLDESTTPTRWFWQHYGWSFARNLAACLKYAGSDSPLISQLAKQHADALIDYAWNKNGKYNWAGKIDADTGWVDPRYYEMAPFAEYYQDMLFVELYRLTGGQKYLEVASSNAPSDCYPILGFPTHNVPAAIEINLDLYDVTGNVTFLQRAQKIGDCLVDWIISKNYCVYGSLENENTQLLQVDNVFHAVLCLLRLHVALNEIEPTPTLTSTPNATPTITQTPTPSPSPTPSPTPMPTPTPVITSIPTPTPTLTPAPAPTSTPKPTPATTSPQPCPSQTPTLTNSPSPTPPEALIMGALITVAALIIIALALIVKRRRKGSGIQS